MNKKTFFFIVSSVLIGLMYFYCENDMASIAKQNVPENDSENSTSVIGGSIDDYFPTSTTKQIIRHDNFSLSYNEEFEQAEWVFYYLSKNKSTTFKRPFFIEDPKVLTRSADWRNYKNSGYDKGHLCPAGDMNFSQKAFEDTFYTSNISPQKKNFNAGVWNRLEQKVRYWSDKYDGIYVATGGVLQKGLKTIGYENVAVPKLFYKVLLHKRNDEYKMIAFLVPHENSNKPLYELAVSVDEVEKLTGIDFFPILPDEIENRLEKSTSYKGWSF